MKLNEFRKYLKKEKIPIAFIINSKLSDPGFFYFSCINPEYGVMLISPKFSARIYCSPLESNQLKNHSGINAYEISKKTPELIKKLIKRYRIKKIGVNFSCLTVNEVKRLRRTYKTKFVDISVPLNELRAVKTKQEAEKIKKACWLSEKIWEQVIKNIKNKKLKTELKVKEFIENEIRKIWCESSFPVIAACGRNTAVPHHMPENKKLNGFCMVDFGVKYKGYCSDITRTIYVGRAGKKEKELYSLVYKTKEYAASFIREGKKASLITKKTIKFLGRYNKYFTHGLGHGFGLEIHEFPDLKEKSKCIFMPGMVFTIEPGIYLKNKFGIRIEDDYLLTKKGLVRLTKAPETLVEV